jgi:dCMP deaminase
MKDIKRIKISERPDIDSWALDGAEWVARRSKDPSHKVGAIILHPDGRLISGGYNGFPRRTNDAQELYNDKTIKRLRIQHAEQNAINFARESLNGCTLYVSPLHPCSSCAGAIINSGIKRVVARVKSAASSDWTKSFEQASAMFQEAGVIIDIDVQD